MYLQDNKHGQPSGTSKQEQLSDDSLRSEDYTSYGQGSPFPPGESDNSFLCWTKAYQKNTHIIK